MKVLKFVFVKVPHRIFRMMFNKWESLYYRFLYSKPELNINFIQKRYLIAQDEGFDSLALAYRELFPDRVQAKISEADLICDHIIDLLGSGPTRLSPEGKGYQFIDWHKDFKSGYKWNPKTYYQNIRYGHIKGVDIKVPWELSRFQHLNILGQAYILTRNRKYVEEFANQITDWIRNNPVGLGVNWKCTMEVAIRVANWLIAQEYFSEEGLIHDDFWNEFYTSIYEHGKFIIDHLENYSGFANNHYLSDLVGLFYIAVYCPFFKESKKWQKFALKELTSEIDKQVYPDGCNFEASTSYHRLALEFLFYAELLGKRSGIEFPKTYKNSVRKMFEFSLYCIKPTGMIPQIGDNDSGRFLIFKRRPTLEHKYLLAFAAIHYEDSDYKISRFDFDEETFWIFGKSGKKSYDELPIRNTPISSKAFPKAGWYIIRHKDDYCFISCGPNGQRGRGGHAHNDKLSFELMVNRQDLVVDPGTYVYTADRQERNKFRSTGYHNTVKFNGFEQSEISEKDIFHLPERIRINKANLRENNNRIIFQGEIQYAGITHERTTTLENESGSWQVTDKLSCSKPTTGKLLFHLSPGLTFDNNDILIKKTKAKIASIAVTGSSFERDEYEYSSEYGVKVKADCLFADIPSPECVYEVRTHIWRMS